VSAPNSTSSPQSPAWPRAAQWAGAFILGAAAIIVAGRILPIFGHSRPTERERIIVVAVDLNSASKSDILQLPGVGEKMADRILASRDSSNGFATPENLRGVKGIGKTRYETLKPHLTVEPNEQFVKSPGDAPQPTMSSRRESKKDLQPGTKIDVNRATVEELQKLEGIGPVMAAKIIEERAKGPFRSPDELRRVKGIGPKTMDKIRPFVTVTGEQ
jgi:competence protein ComEA